MNLYKRGQAAVIVIATALAAHICRPAHKAEAVYGGRFSCRAVESSMRALDGQIVGVPASQLWNTGLYPPGQASLAKPHLNVS